MSETPQPAAPVGPQRRSFKKQLRYVAVALVVILAGVGGGYWWSLRAATVEDHAAEVTPARERGMVTFEPFVVNLADASASRYLRVTIRLVVDSPERAKEAEESPVVVMAARSAILELLTTQTAEVLVTPEGKKALRASITERVDHDGELKVLDVLFSDFVVQF